MDYQPYIEKATQMLSDRGGVLKWHQRVTDPDQAKPWQKTGREVPHDLICCIFPPQGSGSGLFKANFDDGSVEATKYRYIVAAGEGRNIKPESGDTIGPIEGKMAVVEGCKPLDPDNSGRYILYELGVKL